MCILKDGLHANRPCVAQIMLWAANRITTRVEDRAYSLMGLLDVNMQMLYGEGKKAFHCRLSARPMTKVFLHGDTHQMCGQQYPCR